MEIFGFFILWGAFVAYVIWKGEDVMQMHLLVAWILMFASILYEVGRGIWRYL